MQCVFIQLMQYNCWIIRVLAKFFPKVLTKKLLLTRHLLFSVFAKHRILNFSPLFTLQIWPPVTFELKALTENYFQSGFEQLQKRWKKYVAAEGIADDSNIRFCADVPAGLFLEEKNIDSNRNITTFLVTLVYHYLNDFTNE